MSLNLYENRWLDPLGGIHRIHPSSHIGKNVKIGRGTVVEENCYVGNRTFIGHNCVLRPGTVIGDDCTIGHLVVFDGQCTLGDRVLIHTHCHITDVDIEDDVFMAPKFASANCKRICHGRDYPLVIYRSKICRAARIGIGVLLMPGVTIGENAFVGPGSLVIKDVPAREIWYGHPAKKQGEVPYDEIL